VKLGKKRGLSLEPAVSRNIESKSHGYDKEEETDDGHAAET